MDLSALQQKWPSALVARDQIKTFSGGLISRGHLANLDSQGQGISPKLKIGGKVCYRVEDVVRWLESRVEQVA